MEEDSTVTGATVHQTAAEYPRGYSNLQVCQVESGCVHMHIIRRQIDITTYQIRKIKADTSLCLFADEMFYESTSKFAAEAFEWCTLVHL